MWFCGLITLSTKNMLPLATAYKNTSLFSPTNNDGRLF
jgi:hypothetical protein